MAAKSFLAADPSPPVLLFSGAGYRTRGTHEKYGPNILKFTFFQKDIVILLPFCLVLLPLNVIISMKMD